MQQNSQYQPSTTLYINERTLDYFFFGKPPLGGVSSTKHHTAHNGRSEWRVCARVVEGNALLSTRISVLRRVARVKGRELATSNALNSDSTENGINAAIFSFIPNNTITLHKHKMRARTPLNKPRLPFVTLHEMCNDRIFIISRKFKALKLSTSVGYSIFLRFS